MERIIIKKGRRAHFYWEHKGDRAISIGNRKLSAWENQDWKLFDLATDRTEMHDLTKILRKSRYKMERMGYSYRIDRTGDRKRNQASYPLLKQHEEVHLLYILIINAIGVI